MAVQTKGKSMAKYRKKPVEIEAIQWNGNNPRAVTSFVGANGCALEGGELTIFTLEGDMHASLNDWIIRGVAGEFYACKPDIFEQTYEAV